MATDIHGAHSGFNWTTIIFPAQAGKLLPLNNAMDCMRDKFLDGQLLDGRYQTLAPLNHGSFGMVFLARDTETGDEVAVKCLTKPSTTPSTFADLAIDDHSEELVCHALLGPHPHLVNLLHTFETGAHVYLVLEYCSQGDLYEAIKYGRGPLETEHVREFMLQLVNAVEYMHSRGLYHRDIKPENIFLTGDGSMKLGDFGLATRNVWSTESCVGSDRYMAPEQYEPTSNGYSPAKADIWSIGICLLNILFSKNPFVTPTESDILFADYRRDRQSLFDVFPNMSQDTFEILTRSMAIDPDKRSLSAVRDAINRAVSFTIDDESLDDFCVEDRDVVQASAHREPLRTPSIQSPQVNQGDSFPWAKALQSSPPQQIRQLSVIPDTEVYDEDLFDSDHNTGSWYSVHNTPSLASVLDSALSVSLKSMAIKRPEARFPPRSDPVPITGSLPSRVPKPVPAMSTVFSGKKESVSKSWSDLWDEKESENEAAALQTRHEQNSRTWSQESEKDDVTVRPLPLSEVKSSFANIRTRSPGPKPASLIRKPPGGTNENNSAPYDETNRSGRHSPKQLGSDKWAALGHKRRNFQPVSEKVKDDSTAKKHSTTMSWRRDWGLGSSGFDYGAWHRRDSTGGGVIGRRERLDRHWRRGQPQQPTKQLKGRVFDGVVDDDDLEWVGGWQDFHL